MLQSKRNCPLCFGTLRCEHLLFHFDRIVDFVAVLHLWIPEPKLRLWMHRVILLGQGHSFPFLLMYPCPPFILSMSWRNHRRTENTTKSWRQERWLQVENTDSSQKVSIALCLEKETQLCSNAANMERHPDASFWNYTIADTTFQIGWKNVAKEGLTIGITGLSRLRNLPVDSSQPSSDTRLTLVLAPYM